MAEADKVLQAVAWRNGRVVLIDQTALPERLAYVVLTDWRDVAHAIRTMVVRGAPAIGCAAALGLALAARGIIAESRESLLTRMTQIAEVFRAARPTAVNLFWAVDRMLAVIDRTPGNAVDVKDAMIAEAVRMLGEDIDANRALGRHGAELLGPEVAVLTHCNAGALATVGFGTALGVIRAAVEDGKRVRVYADETRPRLQGMKLTAWELHQDGIPVTVIADNMAAVLMRERAVDCVIVGADRIAANGDAANKIGTYGLAVNAHYHGVPFYVAAPLSTVDFRLPDGTGIPIEERETVEMTHIEGIRIAPEGVPVWNPAFDVTPAGLISAIITDRGVARAPYAESFRSLSETAATAAV
ncbi:MAG TPA: S-methyl-5-thioribose-1-phosphate isomerase [Chthonomonadales bacterium]|nr:S-methyl-5-thioribose-1-phosphate isomerase [Chthonomonadales bacterium]